MKKQQGVPMRRKSPRQTGRPRHVIEAGIVLETYLPGHPRNLTGTDVECDVILVNSRQIHRNVPVLQRGSGTHSHGPRWIPQPTRVDLSSPDGIVELAARKDGDRISRLDALDGEQVILAYVRSRNVDPIIIGSLGHSRTTLVPHKTFGRLYQTVNQGTTAGIDDGGSVFIDIRQAKAADRGAVTLQMASDQAVVVTQGPTSITIRSDSTGRTVVEHANGAQVRFEKNGDVELRARGGVTLYDNDGDRLLLDDDSAQLTGGSVTIAEDTNSSNPSTISLTENGIKIQKNEEDLLNLIKEAFELLKDGTSPAGPLSAGPGREYAIQFSDIPGSDGLLERLNKVGDF